MIERGKFLIMKGRPSDLLLDLMVLPCHEDDRWIPWGGGGRYYHSPGEMLGYLNGSIQWRSGDYWATISTEEVNRIAPRFPSGSR